MKNLTRIIVLLFLASCEGTVEVETKVSQSSSTDTLLAKEVKPKFQQYIDSMYLENYRIDTERLKEIYVWQNFSKSLQIVVDGIPIVQFEFPNPKWEAHLNNPKTYFFAKWDPEMKSYKNGNDYLIMTWELDLVGVEKEIFTLLIQEMGNFPCFCFRADNRIYAFASRLSNTAKQTLIETKKLKDFINPQASIYGYYELRKID
jgi:hypothetical protein